MIWSGRRSGIIDWLVKWWDKTFLALSRIGVNDKRSGFSLTTRASLFPTSGSIFQLRIAKD
jgi:hypothetical protein